MRAAGPGKIGALRLGFSMRGGRSVLSDLYRVTPLLVQQALYWDEAMPELPICSIISIGGGILQGDRYTIDISVGEGASAQQATTAAVASLHLLATIASPGDATMPFIVLLSERVDSIPPYATDSRGYQSSEPCRRGA